MTDAEHCDTCDTYDCPGFTTPRAKPEPVPPPRPDRVATDAARRAYIAEALARVEQVRRELRGKQ